MIDLPERYEKLGYPWIAWLIRSVIADSSITSFERLKWEQAASKLEELNQKGESEALTRKVKPD